MEGGRRALAGEGEEEVRERRAVREREAERRVWRMLRRVMMGWEEGEEVVVVSSSWGVLNKGGKEEEEA